MNGHFCTRKKKLKKNMLKNKKEGKISYQSRVRVRGNSDTKKILIKK